MDLKNTALFALIAGMGAMWGQVKNVMDFIISLFVITVDCQLNCTTEAFMIYAWKNLRYVKVGMRRIEIWDTFIKPKDRYGSVAYNCTGGSMVFLDGWRPIFVKNDKEKGGYYPNQIKLSFIRGTFNPEKLMHKISEQYDRENHEFKQQQKRFEIKKFFGKDKDKDQGDDSKPMYVRGSSQPIGYVLDELNAPISNDPFSMLSYNQDIMDFREEMKKWRESEKWYRSRGLRWRFGGGLYGLPGTGKTSFVRATAQSLDLPIHIYDLTTMCNEELTTFWKKSLSAAPCIVLFEDIDRIFDQDRKVLGRKDKAPLTLDCLLNLVNGVEPSDGIVLFVTANDMGKIDPALGVMGPDGKSTRPGRLDRILIFGPLEEKSRRDVANRILKDKPEIIEQVIKDGAGETGAQFEGRCTQIALESYWGVKRGTEIG